MFIDQKIILVDADSIYFRIAYRTKKQHEIRKGIKDMLNDIMKQNESDKMMIAVKGRDNFRNQIYSPYKANRQPQPDDMKKALTYGHSHMVEKYGAVMADGMEADDLVSIWAHECRANEQDYVIAGIDKDLLQIPGAHYNFNKGIHRTVDEDEAHQLLMLQCLTGDSTDNIPGIKGIGPKKAEKILKNVPTSRQWDRVRAAWRGHKAGNPTISRRLLKMLTSWEEYEDIKNQIASETSVSKSDVHEGKESKD